MPDEATADHQVLLELHERGVAKFVLVYGVAFAAIGVVIALFGHYWGLVGLAPLPLFIWLSRNIGSKRLLLTTQGVRYAKRRGTPALDVFAPWPTVKQVELEIKTGRRNDGTTRYTYCLVFDRAADKPIRYMFGSRPSDELLKTVTRICSEHDVPVRG